jgi:acetylglutamate kinase
MLVLSHHLLPPDAPVIAAGAGAGVLREAARQETLIPHLTLLELDALEAAGALQGGMAPKAASIRRALKGGVPAAHLVGGRSAEALLTEIFTNEGSGTMIEAGIESGIEAGAEAGAEAGVAP